MGLYVASCPALNIISLSFFFFLIRKATLNSFYISISALFVEALWPRHRMNTSHTTVKPKVCPQSGSVVAVIALNTLFTSEHEMCPFTFMLNLIL